MITIIPTIEKTTKIKVLALHVLLLSFSALLAQDYNEQLNQYFDLHHQQIELLQKQLHAAIMLCYTMGFLSLSTIGYFLFDYKIHAWLIDCSIWWNAKKNWLKNKWPFDMDNRVKIILVAAALLFLVWVFFTLNRKKDDPNDPKNEQEKEDLQKQTCTKITGSLYLGKKTVARDSIANQVRAGEYSKDVFELYREYRAEAIGAGIPDHFEAIRDYAYWAEADEQVQKDGFCFMNV